MPGNHPKTINDDFHNNTPGARQRLKYDAFSPALAPTPAKTLIIARAAKTGPTRPVVAYPLTALSQKYKKAELP